MVRRLTVAMVLGCVAAAGCHTRAGDMQRIRELKAQRRVVEKAYLAEIRSRFREEQKWEDAEIAKGRFDEERHDRHWKAAQTSTDIYFDYADQLRSIDARIANINARLDAE